MVGMTARKGDALREAVFAHYGTTCACCGSAEELSIDHVAGNGWEHRQELYGRQQIGGVHFYRWLVANGLPEGFQTLCMPCNSSKDTGDRCRLWHGDPAYGRCTKCQKVLPVQEFYRTTQFLSGHRPDCKACFNNNLQPDDLLAALRRGQAAGSATKRARAKEQRLPQLLAAVTSRIEAGEPVTIAAICHLDGYHSARRTLGLPHKEIVALARGKARDLPALVEQCETRWQALKDYLAERIDGDEAVRAGMVADGEHELAAPFGGLVSANRSTLAKMRELEARDA